MRLILPTSFTFHFGLHFFSRGFLVSNPLVSTFLHLRRHTHRPEREPSPARAELRKGHHHPSSP